MEAFSSVGKRIPKIDALSKVTGKSIYIQDLKLPGMLYGKILRSEYPHAKIINIDTSKAKKIIGVRAVITAKDFPTIRFGFLKDQTVLKNGKVRSYRDEVAAVAAIDSETAEEAINLIEVEYEPLPGVFDPEEAMKEDAPLVHEENKSNIIKLPYKLLVGDVEEARKNSIFVVEDCFKLPRVTHCCMGTEGIIAEFDLRSHLTVYRNTQIPYLAEKDFNDALQTMGLKGWKSRVIQPTIGGGFGSKLDTYAFEYIGIMLAYITRRPVKIVYSREEEFCFTSTRQASSVLIAQGCNRDGRLTFRDVSIIHDNGAYVSLGAITPMIMMMPVSSLYKVPNVSCEAKCVYTNNTWSQAMRGYGNPQITFAIECSMDQLSYEAGIDPKKFRLINCNEPGDVTPQRFKITSCGLKECIQEVGRRLDWKNRKNGGKAKGRGVGMASVIHVGGGVRAFLKSDGCGTTIKIDDFGTVNVFTGATDIGQGAETVIAQIVAEEIGVLPEDINIINNDTDVCPWDLAVHASRTTFVAGNSALLAARKVREQILKVAAGYVYRWKDEEGNNHEIKLDEDTKSLVIKDRMVYSVMEGEKKIPIEKILRSIHLRKGGKLIVAESFYDPDTEHLDQEFKGNFSMTYAFGTHGVEVEVDRVTGKVKILKYIAAHDVGRAINPLLVEGQIHGGVMMGIGYALRENLILKKGMVMNPNFLEYKILTAKDVIPVESVMIETSDPSGPYGAKGIGEPTCIPTAAAIANAIFDAVGVRIKELPITPEKILAALKEKGQIV